MSCRPWAAERAEAIPLIVLAPTRLDPAGACGCRDPSSLRSSCKGSLPHGMDRGNDPDSGDQKVPGGAS